MDNDINVKYDVNSLQEVKQLLESKNREYQTSLKDMENFEFLEEAVVTLARNFICIIFAPVYGENIIFDNSDFYNGADSDGYSIEEFIQSEIDFKNNEILEKIDKMR